MASLNKVMIIGKLGRDPEMKNAGTMTAVCRFSVATDEGRRDNAHTEWHNITCFGKTADLCVQYLHKGASAYVEGRLQTRKFQTRDGAERQSTEIIADRVLFLDSRNAAAPAEEEVPMEPAMPAQPTQKALFRQPTALDEMDQVPF